MAPAGKRKRQDTSSADSSENRPSPHRPQHTQLGQHDRGLPDMRDGNRRSSRGGPGGARGRGGRRNDASGRENPNKQNLTGTTRASSAQGPMSPPPPKPPSATQTPVATPTPIIEVAPTTLNPAPFDYTFLTDDRISTWSSIGRQEIISLGTQARQDEDTTDLASLFQELTRSALDGRLDPVDAGSCVKEVLGPDTASDDLTSGFDPSTFFLDTFSMIFEAEEDPISPSLRPFAAATGVSPVSMRHKLDAKLLQELGLTQKTFIRQGVRQATNLLYRQANYNLLREETEGYSKLITELFTTSGSEPPTSEVVEDAFERVKALIGTFDLDVGRVLDITMDVFAAVLIKHFRFFIKLLRVSSWWPRSAEGDGATTTSCGGLPTWALPSSPGWMATEEDEALSRKLKAKRDALFWARAREIGLEAFFELGGRQPIDESTKTRLLAEKSGQLINRQDLSETKEDETKIDPDREWMEHTGTYPPPGNRVAAQLLGFKLRFYTSEARDKDDILPANLIYLTALLIKIGFISLRDLYPHLWPLDSDMPEVREARRKELAEKERLNRPGGGMNALMMAGALPDDTVPSSNRVRETTNKTDPAAKPATETEDKEKLDDPVDQKVQLLTCLLTIGAIPESLFILGRFPWLPEAYPDLVDLINRILNYSVKDVFEATRPLTSQDSECPTKNIPDFDQTGVPKGQVRLNRLPVRKQLRWPFPDKYDINENLAYRFYWDEWTDNVPVCKSVDDIFTLCGTLLNFSGVGIGKDAVLLSKLARIGTKSLAEDPSPYNMDRWQDLLKRLLVPALSLTKSNTSVVNEIYDMLRFYPVHIRYSIYAEWFEGQTSRLPAMKIAFARTKLETQSTMKRISLTNLTAMAKSLAKTAYGSPGVVFSIALSQIEAYTNLTEVVVECAKYFTDLGYDVLVWSLLSSLGGKDRNRTNAEFALLPSRWLLALSRFSGKVFKRYGIMNLSPIIQYVNDQLYRGNSTDLVILKELISQMAGIVPDTDFTDAQLLAMTGGEELRKQTLIFLQDKRYESTKTAKRLMKALTETKLCGELLISIAQHRQAAIYNINDADAHIKLLATMVDDSNSILFQYLDLLRSNLSPEEFDNHVPSIPELLTDFGLDPTLAFLIGRGSIAYRISQIPVIKTNGAAKVRAASKELKESSPTIIDQEGDISMVNGNEAEMKGDQQADQTPTPSIENLKDDAKVDDAESEALAENTPSPEAISFPIDPLQEILDPVIESVKTALPSNTFRGITADFYVIFWTTTSGDIEVSKTAYEAEMQRCISMTAELSKDRSDMTRAGMARKEELKNTLSKARAAVFTEYGKQIGVVRIKKARLLAKKDSWFEPSAKPDDISNVLLERCLLPRLLLSPSDADYSFKMIKFVHENGIPHFRTLTLWKQFFKSNRLRTLIFTSSIREAENLGRFLRLVLTDFSRWYSDKEIFQKEAWGEKKNLAGFAKALDEQGKPKGFIEHDSGLNSFKNILLFWHKALNTALRDCLEGTEWMHIRNAITVLKSVGDVFPAVDFMGNNFIKQLETVASREKKVREDLSLTANATLVQLKKRAKHWVMVQAFGTNTAALGQNGAVTSSKTARSALKPNAPEFKPQSRASSLGVSTPKIPNTMEVEDGEVDDAKISTPTTSSASKITLAESKSVPPEVANEPKKSEILERREQVKREQAAKASNQHMLHPAIPPRPEMSNRTSILDRASPNLPNRPDGPFPSRDLLDRHPSRHGDRRDGKDGRESRLHDSRGMERPSDRSGDRNREFPPNDRRGVESNLRDPRDFGRSSDRLVPMRDSRRPEPPPRWTGESRESLERQNNNTRPTDIGRLSRDMPPPRSLNQTSDRGPVINSERIALVNPERQELINPERAALISGDQDTARSNSPRRGRDESHDRLSSRPQSPRRHISDKDHQEPRREDRASRIPPSDYNAPRSRNDEIQQPPAGPRSERSTDRDRTTSNDRTPFQPQGQIPSYMDPEHGRLNVPSRQQIDPNFGRLNPTTISDIPSGPRGRDSRGSRMQNMPATRRDARMSIETPRPPTPERQPPTGPSSGRHTRRSTSDNINTTVINSTQTTTPSAVSPITGVHPDRLWHLSGSTMQQPLQQTNSVLAPPIHPDRLKALGESVAPMSNPINNNRSRPQIPPLSTSNTPIGPKNSQQSPGGPSSNGVSAPTGPASASERARRNNNIRPFHGLAAILGQKESDLSPNVRGRGRMSSNMGQDTPISGPSTPVIPPSQPGLPPTRAELAINPERADLITGGSNMVPSDDRERDRNGRRERSGRHSRRSSRSPAREREPKRGGQDEERAGYRDRSDRRTSERDSRHTPRTSAGDELMPGRESGRDRERERDSGRHSGRDRESTRDGHEAGWGGERGGGSSGRNARGGEERRDSRGNREDGGRKRHSDDGVDTRGREKRPRNR